LAARRRLAPVACRASQSRLPIEEAPSDPASTIVLPQSAPQRLGVLTRKANVFQFEPAPGVAVTIDGTPAAR
jgi:hypothetical protein